ncbi:MAG: ABC transporter permease [Planctomycetaceae bacterium]|nr:ABC transporter permease [Planctomycetaceae bacterium]
MFRFAPYIWKTLWRHRTRSLLTVSGASVAIFVLCFIGSIQEGLNRMVQGEDAQRRLIVFQENRFCPTSSRLPEDYSRQIAQVSGVTDVLPIQVWTNNCRASLDVVVVHGVPAAKLPESRELRLIEGQWPAFVSRTDAAVVGRQFALRRRVRLGDQLTFGSMSVHVAGIFESDSSAEEDLIYCHLLFLQLAESQTAAGLVTQLEVALDPSAEPDRVAKQIDEKLRSGLVPTTTRPKGAFQTATISDLVDLIGYAYWLGLACVGLVLSLVATTTVMSVQDRVQEHAVLQTLGVRPGRVMRLILAESTLLCFWGGALGVGLAWTILTWGNFSVGAEGVAITLRPSSAMIASGLGISVILGSLAGIIPAYQATRTNLVSSLRQS